MNDVDNETVVIRHDDATTGAENMALDIELLDLVRTHKIQGAFRTYTWQPWAVSLGKHQSPDVVDSDRANRLGIDIVVRPTGGRAVLHADELTYCIVTRGNPRHIYTEVHRILQRSINSILSIELTQATDAQVLRRHYAAASDLGQACFAASAQHEILFDGRKIVGSAQRVIDGVILQHGSILCGDSHLLLSEILVMSDEKREGFATALRKSSISLSEAAHCSVSSTEVQAAIRTIELDISRLIAENHS